MMMDKTITNNRKTKKERTQNTLRKRLSKYMNACFKVKLN